MTDKTTNKRRFIRASAIMILNKYESKLLLKLYIESISNFNLLIQFLAKAV